MPELPEVQTVVTTLAPKVVGRTITRVDVRRQDILTPPDLDLPALLIRRTIAALTRRGKRIVFTLDDNARFYIHLGMTGRLTTEPPATPIAKHTHLILTLSPQGSEPPAELRFSDPRRFGGLFLLPNSDSDDHSMGPEPLQITSADLAERLKRTKRPIKNALMDQRVIAGLGNIYVDESLFESRIHPLTLAHRLTAEQVTHLTAAIQTVLTRAITHRGSTLRDYRDADGNAGSFQSLHKVYARANQPCTVCKSPLRRIILGGRSTHFCPSCQPPRRRPAKRKARR